MMPLVHHIEVQRYRASQVSLTVEQPVDFTLIMLGKGLSVITQNTILILKLEGFLSAARTRSGGRSANRF